MRVLIFGGDGYLGWPTAMALAARGHEVLTVDNYLRRTLALQTNSEPLMPTPTLEARAAIFQAASGFLVEVAIGDLQDYGFMSRLVETHAPEAIVHYAEQPSAPYSMRGYPEAALTFQNNLTVTFNCIWAVLEQHKKCHIIKLGTMGEYGTPNIDIEEGYIEINHKGRTERFLFPRQAGTLYHTTKVLDTDLLWFYVRLYNLRVTDLMQGPVYGIITDESAADSRLYPHFNYDDIFGTLVNRFLVQAVAGVPLTVYGRGGQTRGYINIRDTINCIEMAMFEPAQPGQLRVFNQIAETLSVNEIAEKVVSAGKDLGYEVQVRSIPNPRKEKEEHYYNPTHTGLRSLGLEPNLMTREVLAEMMERVAHYKGRIDTAKVLPRVKWT